MLASPALFQGVLTANLVCLSRHATTCSIHTYVPKSGRGAFGKQYRKYPGIVLPREIGATLHVLATGAGLADSRRPALPAWTPIPQKLPRINPQLVPVIEMKLDRILAHGFCRSRFHRRLEHGQRPRYGLLWLSRLLMRLRPLLVAQRAGTGIPQERKRIVRLVPVLPLDIESRARAQVHFYRLRIRHCRHEFSIAQLTLTLSGHLSCVSHAVPEGYRK